METKKLVPDSNHDDVEPETGAQQPRDYGGTQHLDQQISAGECDRYKLSAIHRL